MTDTITIALDAMGGDNAPFIVIDGAARFLRKYDGDTALKFMFFGDEKHIGSLVARHKALAKCSKIIHTEDVITNDQKPSAALRQGRKSSMYLAIQAVAKGEADYVVSAGNTGALMAISLFVLKRLPGVARPAIASVFPSSKKDVVMLDLGANVECDAENLVQFAILGSVFHRTVSGKKNPSVGLLNIGEEEGKGKDTLKLAFTCLQETQLPGEFKGFIEGNDIGKGTVDVIVTDGFTGNVALKTMEGTANLLYDFMKRAFFSDWLSKALALLSYFSFKRFKSQMDPRNYNGGIMLGLNGICVKSHGGTDHKGFSNAILFGYKMAHNKFNDDVRRRLARYSTTIPELEADIIEPNNLHVGGK